jgi:hypothetical protein
MLFMSSYSLSVTRKDAKAYSLPITSATPTPSASSAAAPAPTIQAASPSATPSPVLIDPASLKISVLNGSGRYKIASQASDALISAGFTVTTIGNAFDTAVTQSVIQFPTGQEQAAHLIAEALQDLYPKLVLQEQADQSQFTVIVQ